MYEPDCRSLKVHEKPEISWEDIKDTYMHMKKKYDASKENVLKNGKKSRHLTDERSRALKSLPQKNPKSKLRHSPAVIVRGCMAPVHLRRRIVRIFVVV